MKKIILLLLLLAVNYNSFAVSKEDKERESSYLLQIKNENDSDAMFDLGLLYDEQEKYDLAEKYYLMAVKYNNGSAMTNLGLK